MKKCKEQQQEQVAKAHLLPHCSCPCYLTARHVR